MSEPPPDLPVLATPAEKVEPVIEDWERLAELERGLANGSDPVALDSERASGFRYFNWAYLIQLKTATTGIALIDPIALTTAPPADLSGLNQALAGREWVLHAASQDLPCLAELGLRPERLFDTELAARLVGRNRVGLGPLVEDILGVRLLKEHSAADWSTRPLPADWLTYAALDVELLVELRDHLDAELVAAGKREWAEEEFQYWIDATATPLPPREEPWRRTAGLHQVRSARGMALVRELWHARDDLARQFDIAPGRILKDAGISELATRVRDNSMVGPGDIATSEWFQRRTAVRFRTTWVTAIERAAELKPQDWPPLRRPLDGPPALRSWRSVRPEAVTRWERVRPVVNTLAEHLNMPPENLLSPDSLRRLAWEPQGFDAAAVQDQLASYGARTWQRDLVTAPIVEALTGAPPATEAAPSAGGGS
jgi:ribonuclease D